MSVTNEKAPRKSATAKALEAAENAAKVKAEAKKRLFTPSQTIEQIADKVPDELKTFVKDELQGALMDMLTEATSAVSIGMHLVKVQDRVESSIWPEILDAFANAVNRSVVTMYAYIGRARSVAYNFAKNPMARNELIRVFDFSGCFDGKGKVNSELLDKVLKLHPIPSSKADGAECAIWARKFADEAKSQVRANRKRAAQVAKDEAWDLDTLKAKRDALKKNFTAFYVHAERVNTEALLTAVFIAMADDKAGPLIATEIIAKAYGDYQKHLANKGIATRKASKEQSQDKQVQ